MPTLTIGDRDVQVDDSFLSLPPDRQNAAVDEIAKSMGVSPAAKESGGIGQTLSDVGRFAGTAVARGLGGLADFATDPLSPIRRMIDPRLENMEQSIRPHPGQAAGDLAFSATGIPEYKPTTPAGRVGLATAEGAVAGGPFGLGGALAGALGGALGQGTYEGTGSERLATAAGLAPALIAPAARGAANLIGGKARDTLGPAVSQSYREGLAGEQLRSAASDLDNLKSSLNVDQVGPIDQSLVSGSRPTTFQLSGDMGIGQLERGARTKDAAPFLERASEQNKARIGQIEGLAPENAQPGAVRDLLRQRLAAIDADGEANIAAARQNAQQAFDQTGGTLAPDLYGALMRDQLEAAKTATKANESRLWRAIDPDNQLTIGGETVRGEANRIFSELPKMAKPQEGEESAIFSQARMLPQVMPFNEFSALRGRLLDAIREERSNGQTPALRRMQQLRAAMDETISGAADQAAQADAGLVGRISGELSGIGTATQARTGTGGLNGPGAATVSGRNAQAARGIPGAAGNQESGPGNAPGRAGVQGPPPKPQDLVEFLISRGGVADDGGELRAMDTDRVSRGWFGRLAHKNGRHPDNAREIAEEAGYLPQGSTVSDLFDAIHDTTVGRPVFSAKDADIVADWDHYMKTGEAPPVAEMPSAPANFDAEAAGRYRAAADATRERAQTFNNQTVGPALQERGSEYRMLESRVPQQFLRSPEGIQAFLSAGGDAATLRDALSADLRRSAATPEGTLDPQKYASWQRRRADAIRAFPELQQTLGDAARAQEAVDAVSAFERQRSLDFQNGAARHFLNAEPDKAVQSAFASKNPVADFAELAKTVGGDADAKAGLQRAVADYIGRNYVGNTEAGTSGVGTVKSDAFQTFMKRHSMALAKVFSPEQIQGMRNVAADLQRSNRSIAGSKIPGQSNTAQDLALQGGNTSLLRTHLGDAAIGAAGGLAGYLMGDVGGALIGMQAGVAKSAVSRLRAAGIEKTSQLVTEALLNPELARTLLMKPSAANRPLIAGSLNTALGRIVASSATRQDTQNKNE